MNLQENIHRIQSMMGVITEDDKTSKISKMIEDIGLSNAIKFFGGVKDFEELFQEYDISRENKIKFIKETVVEVCDDMGFEPENGFWVIDIGMEPIVYFKDEDILEQMELFTPDYVVVFMYGGEDNFREQGDFKDYYEDLSESTLDKIVEFMIETKSI